MNILHLTLEIIGGALVLYVGFWVVAAIIDYLLYTLGYMIFLVLSIDRKKLPGRRLATLKHFLKVPFWVARDTWNGMKADSARTQYIGWKPYFKYTDYRKIK